MKDTTRDTKDTKRLCHDGYPSGSLGFVCFVYFVVNCHRV
jgi:hypothetical protein